MLLPLGDCTPNSLSLIARRSAGIKDDVSSSPSTNSATHPSHTTRQHAGRPYGDSKAFSPESLEGSSKIFNSSNDFFEFQENKIYKVKNATTE